METPHLHASHADVKKRLKRGEGHLRSVITMLEDGRPCAEIAQQLHAVEAAIRNAKRILIHDHIDHCLEPLTQTDATIQAAFRDLQGLTKYL